MLPDWYPADVGDEIDLDGDTSPNGEPEPTIMAALHRRLRPASRIADVAGGDGRYALPLAQAGHDVTIVDVDEAHLRAARRSAAAMTGSTTAAVRTVRADVTSDAERMYAAAGFDQVDVAEFTIDDHEPYRFRTDVLVASGVRTRA